MDDVFSKTKCIVFVRKLSSPPLIDVLCSSNLVKMGKKKMIIITFGERSTISVIYLPLEHASWRRIMRLIFF